MSKQTVLQDAAINRKVAQVQELLSSQGSDGLASVLMQPHGQTVLIDVAMKCAGVVTDPTLHDADEGYLREFIDIAKLLVEHDKSKLLVRQTDAEGWNVVHHCVPQETGADLVAVLVPTLAELCEFFLSKGCAVDAKDKSGVTALYWAVSFGNDALAPLVQVLLRRGANPNGTVPADRLVRSKMLPEEARLWDTPLKAAEGHHRGDPAAEVDPAVPMDKILSLLRLDANARKALPSVGTERPRARGSSSSSATGPAAAGSSHSQPSAKQSRKRASTAPVLDRVVAVRVGGSDPGPSRAADTSALQKQLSEVLKQLPGMRDALAKLIEKPTVELVDTDFSKQECFRKGKLQIYSNEIKQARAAIEQEWTRTLSLPLKEQMPEMKIVNCYGTSGGSINPPYTPETPYFYLLQNLKEFFRSPWHGMPGTRVAKVPDDDPRQALHGQATVYAEKDFKPWDIIGGYTGRVMTTEELSSENTSLLMLNKMNDYTFQFKTQIQVGGEEVDIVMCPYPTYGNMSMAINDGKRDDPTGKKVNCGWMEMQYKGWPYIFVVATRKGIKRGDELLLDYCTGAYWKNKEEMDFEHQGHLEAMESDEMQQWRDVLMPQSDSQGLLNPD